MQARVLAAFLITVLLAAPLAGCFGKDDESNTSTGTGTGDPGTGTGTGDGDGFTGDDDTGDETMGDDENATEEPEEPAPPQPVNETVTISLPAGPMQSGEAAFNVPADGWMTFEIALTVSGTESSGSDAPAGDGGFGSDGITITLLDPEGNEAGTYNVPAGPNSGPVTGAISPSGGTMGQWTLTAAATTVNAPGVTIEGHVMVTY